MPTSKFCMPFDTNRVRRLKQTEFKSNCTIGSRAQHNNIMLGYIAKTATKQKQRRRLNKTKQITTTTAANWKHCTTLIRMNETQTRRAHWVAGMRCTRIDHTNTCVKAITLPMLQARRKKHKLNTTYNIFVTVIVELERAVVKWFGMVGISRHRRNMYLIWNSIGHFFSAVYLVQC